jgi:DNA polymerase-3 subunit beta
MDPKQLKFTCEIKDLKNAINKVEKTSQKNVENISLACVLLEVKDSKLILRTTNMDIWSEVRIAVKDSVEGSTCVLVGVFSSLLASLLENTVSVFLEGAGLVVKTEKTRTVIKTVSINDFPETPKIENAKNIKISSESLIQGAKSVSYAASVSSIKPELSSVYVFGEENELVFVATDSFRLAEKRLKIKEKSDFSPLLIPQKNFAEVVRFLDGFGEVTLATSQGMISFFGENFSLVSRVVEGNFPDYKRIIPKTFVSEVEILKQDFVDSLKTVNNFIDSFGKIRISFEENAKNVELSSKDNEKGETKILVSSRVNGQGLDINFNCRYLSDCLQSLTADTIVFNFSGQNKSVIVRGKGVEGFLYLVMPMNK